MFVICPECDRRFNASESTAGKQVSCPDCGSLVTLPRRSKTGAARKASGTVTAGKKRRGAAETKPASGIDLRIVIGGGAAAVVVVIGLLIVVVRGFGGRGPVQDAAAVANNPSSEITATTVVFTEPLASAPGPEAKTAFPLPEPVAMLAAAPAPKFADDTTPAPEGDRTGLVAATPTPPASWSALPKPPAPVPGLIGAYNVPNTPPLFGDAHVGFVAGFEPPADPKLTEKLRWDARRGNKEAIAQLQANSEKALKGTHWFRYDLRTGKYAGKPVRLDSAYDAFNFNQTVTAMAMSRDGSRLALRHPLETSRIDVYDAEGSRGLTFTPYAADVPVQWVGWSGSGKLLTLGDGKLTGWSVPEGKAAFEIEGKYHVPVRQVRGNAWLAAPASDHIDLLDTETGACLGRCALTGNDYDASRETDMAIAADGTGLFYHALHKQPDWQKVGVVFGWDLTTGQALPPAVSERPPGGGLEAVDRQRLLLGGAFDVKASVIYAAYMVPPPRTYDWFPLPPQYRIPGSPDGRTWTWGPEPGAEDSRRFMLRVIEFPGIETGPSPAQVFTKATPLTVEADMGDKARSDAFGKNLLKALQAQGFTIGKGGWTLRATCDVKSSETNLTMKGWGGKVNVPEVAVHYKLYSPEGELAHATGMTLQLGTGSKYFRGQRQVSQKGIEITLELTWEFPDRNPREAIIEELLEDLGTGADRSNELRLPAPIGRFQGKFDLLPVTANAVFPPVPAPGN